MNLKLKLTLINFMQFFVWGAWLTTIGTYCFSTKGWSGEQFGAIFSTIGIASVVMPPITGIIADRWINAEKLYAVLHILYACTIAFVPQIDDPGVLYVVILIAMVFYMPTLALSYSIGYSTLSKNNFDVVKVFPKVRVWGTVGFIAAMWCTNFSNFDYTKSVISELNFVPLEQPAPTQFYIAAFGALFLGVYSFTLPKCPPLKEKNKKSSLVQVLGLDAFKLFANYKMALFFIFSLFLGGALQLTNMYADTFLRDFEKIPEYANSFAVKNSTFIVSISQISETLFILAIPFFLKRYGIKNVILISMVAWVLRFGLFAYGDPSGLGLVMLVTSMIVYGMAFDFFNISGSLFVETTTDSKIRSSAQGVFMMMTNGFGAILGSKLSGFVIDEYFTQEGIKDWHNIWLSFAIYSLVITLLFAIMFKHQHNPKEVEHIAH